MKLKKRFFTKHTKSSAAVVTLVLHGIFLVLGLSFVVMKTFIEEETVFVHRVPVREHVSLRELRPPSSARKPKPVKPNFARVPVNVKMDQKVPDITWPDLQSLTGEIGGSSGSSENALSTIAFSMPELKIFDVRGRGEKIFLILDAGEPMLEDQMGGIPAYSIIKQEMIRIISELPSTAVFNVCVFGNGQTQTLFPALVSAGPSNTRKVEAWLNPLNGAEESVLSGRYGIRTLGAGGIEHKHDLRTGRFQTAVGEHRYRQERWFVPAMVAMQQQADTIFLLTNTWGAQRRVSEERSVSMKEWLLTSDGRRWLEHAAIAKEKLAAENLRRKKAGQPPRVIAHGRGGLIRAYYPGTPGPPSPEFYYFTPQDFQDAFAVTRTAVSERDSRLALKKRKHEFTFNVIQFVPANSDSGTDARFRKLTRLSRGNYQTIAGLEAIQSYIESE